MFIECNSKVCIYTHVCLFSGSVPAFYREVYDIVCPNQEQVDRDLFVQLLVRSSLPKSTAMQVNKQKNMFYFDLFMQNLFLTCTLSLLQLLVRYKHPRQDTCVK